MLRCPTGPGFPFPENKRGHCPIIPRALHKRFLHKSDAKVIQIPQCAKFSETEVTLAALLARPARESRHSPRHESKKRIDLSA